jgi:two-component system cell cycle sensor histidine kinase/response regulator CckA
MEMKTDAVNVLLIDDDEDDYILTRELLSETKVGKYELDWASSYEKGLKVAGRGEHQVCLVDYRLGEHSGVQLIREARESGLTTPMILLTGQGSHEVDVEAMEAGAIGYLVKDESATERLERTLRYAIEINTEHSRVEKVLGAYAQKHAAVADLGRLALIGTELNELFTEAVSLVVRTLGVEYCKVLELLPDGEALILKAGVGWKKDFVIGQATVSAAKESQAGFTLLSDEPVIVEDLRTESRFSDTPLVQEHGVVSGMSVIIRGRERPYGVLGAHTTSTRRFTADEINFLSSITNVLAEAISRKRVEDEVSQSEAKFRALFENALDAVLIANDSGVYMDANPAACALLGVSYDEVIGRTVNDFTEKNYRAETPGTWEQFLKEGVMRGEFRLQRSDGKVVEVEFSATANFLPGRHLSMLRDVSERKRAEESLLAVSRQLEATVQDYRQVIDNSLDVICTIDGAGRFSQVSRASEAVWGYSPEELVGRAHIDLVHADDRAKTNHAAADIMAGHATRGFENRYMPREGKAVDMMWSAVWSETEQTMFCVARNMSEIKQGEAERDHLLSELESERARLVDIFTHAPAFIASLRGPEHIFELANTHYYDLVGQRDLIGSRVRDVLPEVEGQGFFELLDQVYATGVPFVANEMPIEFTGIEGAPRDQRYLNFVYQPLTGGNGAVSGIICHGVDVTEQVLSRRRLEETEKQLRQSQKLESVGMLAGGIAHDFNNLLTVITGYSDLILRRLDKIDPLARNIEEIKKAAERATTLTRQLLAFSRKQVLQPKILNLNSVISNIEKMLGRLIGEDMELRTAPSGELGQIKADPGQIEQVIFNLAVNARDAMPKGGKITIETANVYLNEAYARLHIAVQPGWYAMLAVTDTGCGMDAQTQRQIFEPFFTTKEQGKGTGLGLSTLYGIVKQSGGNVWVYSEVGVGTTFKIFFPIVKEQVTALEADAERPQSLEGTETILLAEDEEMVRNLARESLTMHGYTVLEAANTREALLIGQQHEGAIHLLLTDVVMPQMSGRELAEQLVRLRPDMSVLYMSGYPDQSIVHHGILDEDIAFISKPFTPDALVLKVVAVLRQIPSSASRLKR